VKRTDLDHIIRAAGAVLGDDTVIILGSQAILASFGEDDLPPAAARSLEVDLLPLEDPDGKKADKIAGALGELTQFDAEYGIHADGVSEATAVLPSGWRERLITYCNPNTNGISGLCLERHDLCVAKLVAHREKDLEFVSSLLATQLVEPGIIIGRLDATGVPEETRARIAAFVRAHGSKPDDNTDGVA